MTIIMFGIEILCVLSIVCFISMGVMLVRNNVYTYSQLHITNPLKIIQDYRDNAKQLKGKEGLLYYLLIIFFAMIIILFLSWCLLKLL